MKRKKISRMSKVQLRSLSEKGGELGEIASTRLHALKVREAWLREKKYI